MTIHGTRLAGIIALVALGMAALLAPRPCHAVELNLATVTCDVYEKQILTTSLPGYTTDPIDTVMWLFGFAIARSGDRVMYGDSLKSFGLALDAECKNNPATTLLQAVTSVKSERGNPMDLTRLDCASFAPRHASVRESDPESATTLTMWLFGYAVGLSGSNMFNPDATSKFDAALDERCAEHPKDSLFDALNAPNPAVPRTLPPPKPRRKPNAPTPAPPAAAQ